ncbi:pirin family protein [Gloeobacter kilaueensis]|uniref:Pirin-related protein n=1 Tax=Gloeobacter kilaueensis (strain ATCC BAA-2537 / CCAP 1431/1 / ULC 316 / JS1) TaxID=1183438 RepID=U5QJH5_GLOK1|nr:pirin family protein [Gloeobacter kilaueensis]AGY59142.1 pirin-related protein [Gloeobacter kilaueensis JS1]
MITLRAADERGHANHGWLDTQHTFSFADYYDPKQMGFRALRVINEDRVMPGAGFGTHPHRDMEIITYILEGALEHKDSMGNGSIIRPGDVQRMSAGTGVTHSEFNPSRSEPVHLLQIWILPSVRGIAPSYEQQHFDAASRQGRFLPVVAGDGREGTLKVHQDMVLYAGLFAAGESARLPLGAGRHGWLQVARGVVDLGGQVLKSGDGAALSDEGALTLTAKEPAEVLLFDLP